MRPLINFSILMLFPSVLQFSSNETALTANPVGEAITLGDEKYCNSRFDYCLIFASDILSTKVVADNDDGIRLASNDGKIYAEVSGANNVGNWSITDIYQLTIEGINTDNPNDVKYLYHEIGKSAYEAMFEYGGELHYYKTVLHNRSSIVSLMIAVPKGEIKLLNRLKDEVVLELHNSATNLN